MPVELITNVKQVSAEWLTEVLTREGVLQQGLVAAVALDTGLAAHAAALTDRL